LAEPKLPPANNRGILPLLWSFAFLSYLLRTNISVAQQFMAREMGWTDAQVGAIFTAFLVGYTLFQVPAGVLGDRFGPRLVLAVSALWWAVTTLSTGLVPGKAVVPAATALLFLLVIRFLHGAGEASTYPVLNIALRDYFTPPQYAFVDSLMITGSTAGAAFAPPLVAYIMTAVGWRSTFYVTAALPLILGVLWWRRTRTARGHHRVEHGEQAERPGAVKWGHLLKDRGVVFLCLSYLLYCYSISIFVYWLFKYLVDVRHLSILGSGWATSLPWIAACLVVPCVGWISTRLSATMGRLPARRWAAVICLLIAAMLMFVVASSADIRVALGAITASVALLFSTESSYWSMAIELAPKDPGAAAGLMNLMGNAGGILATSLVPVLAHAFGWFTALVSGSVFALLAALSWFLIRHLNGQDLSDGTAH
jgi:MFS transporter, ACS family, glucarate transporter